MNDSIDPNDVLVRPAFLGAAEDSDAPEIARIYNHYVDAGGATFDKVHWQIENVPQLLKVSPPNGCYVAELNGRLLGWASARKFSDRDGYKHSCETAIYLDPIAIGQTIADLLQCQIESHCCDNKIHHAVAKIIADNQRSLRFHYRYGYELVGIQKEIGRVNDQWVDVAILQKIFDA